MKSAKEAIQTAKNVVAFPKPPARRQRDEIAFLPAALEIVERRRRRSAALWAQRSSPCSAWA
jgi:hypothetical protein